MHVGFRIVTQDKKVIESHDKMWNEVKDHVHALPPNNVSPWKSYSLVTDDGHDVKVDFESGEFNLNGVTIQPGNDQGESQTHEPLGGQFEADPPRDILTSLPYFPIFGRRIYKGDWGEAKVWFCGWKRKFGERTIQRVVYFYPNGKVVFV